MSRPAPPPPTGAQRSVTAALRLKTPPRLKEPSSADAMTRLGVPNVATAVNDNVFTKSRSVYDPEDVDPFNVEIRPKREATQLENSASFVVESPSSHSVASSYPSSPELASPGDLMASISETVDSLDYLSHVPRSMRKERRMGVFAPALEQEAKRRQSLAESNEVQGKINRVFELARSGNLESEEMRALVGELEDYYSGRSSQEWEPSAPDRSLDPGAWDVARSHVLGVNIPGVEVQRTQLTNPENALGLYRVDHGVHRSHAKNALPTPERPSMIPRLQRPNVDAVKTSARTGITGPQLHPSRQGLGPRSLSDPTFRSKPDGPPIINHSRSWSLKSLIPRRTVTKTPVKPKASAILDVKFDFEPPVPSPQDSRFSVSTAGPSPRPDGFRLLKPRFGTLAKYSPPPALDSFPRKELCRREKRYGFVPILSKAFRPQHHVGKPRNFSQIPRRQLFKAKLGTASHNLPVKEAGVQQLPLPMVSGRWSTNWDDVLRRIGTDAKDGDSMGALVLKDRSLSPGGPTFERPSMVAMLPRGPAQIRKGSGNHSKVKAHRRIGRFFGGINWSMPSLSNSRAPSRCHTPGPSTLTSPWKQLSRPARSGPLSRVPIPVKRSAECQILLPSILGVLDGSIDMACKGKHAGVIRALSIASRLPRTPSATSKRANIAPQFSVTSTTHRQCRESVTPASLPENRPT